MSLGVPTMNKVWFATMHAVIMALVAKRHAVTQFMAQVWTLSNLLDVMCFKFAVCPAMLALIPVTFQYGGFPFQIFGAAPALILSVVFALGNSLTFPAAINMLACSHGWALYELLTANLAGEQNGFTAALYRAIDFSANMRPGTKQGLSASCTCNHNLLRLRGGCAIMGAKSFLGIFIPIAIVLFWNELTTGFAGL